MKMEKWDQEIAGPLSDIEYSCRWVRYFMERVSKGVQEIPARPEFKTQAAQELEKTINEIERYLAELQAAKKKLSEKKIVR